MTRSAADDSETDQGMKGGIRSGNGLVGSVAVNESNYPMHLSLVGVSSQRTMIKKAFSVPKCLRLGRLTHHSHRLLRKMWGAVSGPSVDDLSDF